MKSPARIYNQTRWTLLILGFGFIAMAIHGLLNPESVHLTERGGLEITGTEKTESFIYQLIIGIVFLVVRFRFMKHRKNNDFSNDIPLPMNVSYEKTDDPRENVRRYRQAQIDARDAIRKKSGQE